MDLPKRAKRLRLPDPNGPAPKPKKNPYNRNWTKIRGMVLRSRPFCELMYPKVCQHEAKHVHHIDKDPFNNSPTNLMPVCHACHNHLHKTLGY